jgi:transposase
MMLFMKASSITDRENVIFILQDEIRRTDEARYDHRLHAILLVAQGMSSRQAAQLLGDSPRTVAYWVQRFEAEGLAGLADADRPGRPRRMDQQQIDHIERALRKSPLEYGLSANLWDGKTLSAYIQQQFGVRLGVRQCQRLFRQLGFRMRKPRSKIAHADPSKQEAFKKNPKTFKG